MMDPNELENMVVKAEQLLPEGDWVRNYILTADGETIVVFSSKPFTEEEIAGWNRLTHLQIMDILKEMGMGPKNDGNQR